MSNFSESIDLSINFKDLKLIDKLESRFQKIFLFRHKLLGKVLILNNEVQHVERWAPLYHELLVHLPAAYIPKFNKVLILGGGSLFAACEVLKYNSVKSLSLIDHDYSVIDIIKKNYSHARKVIKDIRFNLVIDDAFEFLKRDKSKYDLILNDSIDLLKYCKITKIDLMKLLCDRLNNNGICSDVVYRHIFEKKTTLKTINNLRKNYESTFSLITVPEYPGIFHILCLWSKTNKFLKKYEVVNPIQKKWLKIKKSKFLICQFYHPQFIYYYNYLPNYLKTILKKDEL